MPNLTPSRFPVSPISRGLFITATDTEVGKTVVAGAIARWFAKRGYRTGVCKPIATGCRHDREGLVSEDAEFLAYCADSVFPLDVICPQRFSEPLAPAVALERAGRSLDWETIRASLAQISSNSDLTIVEGIGGVMVPIEGEVLLRDLIRWLNLPAIVVARPGLGTINHTLLTLNALRSAGIAVAGVVVNRYKPDSPSLAEETNLAALERWGHAPLLTIVPDEPFTPPNLPPGIIAAIDRMDWGELVK